MTKQEYIEYIFGYVKACKIKGHKFIAVYGSTLLCCDEMISMLYRVQLEYPCEYTIANTDDEITNDNLFDTHILNILSQATSHIVLDPTKFLSITRKDINEPIPTTSDFSAKPRIYYFDINPSKEILLYDFYNMMPLSKADNYTIEASLNTFYPGNVYTIKYNVYKKKPKCTIEIYRNILSLI